jgi:hypothetical protein
MRDYVLLKGYICIQNKTYHVDICTHAPTKYKMFGMVNSANFVATHTNAHKHATLPDMDACKTEHPTKYISARVIHGHNMHITTHVNEHTTHTYTHKYIHESLTVTLADMDACKAGDSCAVTSFPSTTASEYLTPRLRIWPESTHSTSSPACLLHVASEENTPPAPLLSGSVMATVPEGVVEPVKPEIVMRAARWLAD